MYGTLAYFINKILFEVGALLLGATLFSTTTFFMEAYQISAHQYFAYGKSDLK